MVTVWMEMGALLCKPLNQGGSVLVVAHVYVTFVMKYVVMVSTWASMNVMMATYSTSMDVMTGVRSSLDGNVTLVIQHKLTHVGD